MANITINEISQNYTYNIGNNSYASVALPITSSWGPGFEDPQYKGMASDEVLESVVWTKFPATQAGLESFVSTFRGPTTQYMLHQDYSYQTAMTLLTSGYDLLVTRIATGKQASGKFLFISGGEPVVTEDTGLASLSAEDLEGLDITAQEASSPSFKGGSYSKPLVLSPGSYKSYVSETVEIEVVDEESTRKFNRVSTKVTYEALENPFAVKAKYLGSFGNNLIVTLRKLNRISNSSYVPYWNCIVYIQSSAGIRTAVENLNFVFNVEYSTDQILHIDEIESKFLTFTNYSNVVDDREVDIAGSLIGFWDAEISSKNTPEERKAVREAIAANLGMDSFSQEDVASTSYNSVTGIYEVSFFGGSDLPNSASTTNEEILSEAITLAQNRYSLAYYNDAYRNLLNTNKDLNFDYINGIEVVSPTSASGASGSSMMVGLEQIKASSSSITKDKAKSILFREWMFTAAYTIFSTLSDKLAYNPNRLIVPGWDDQDYRYLANDNSIVANMTQISPLHIRLMDLAYLSRCATAYLDIPRSISRNFIYNESLEPSETGYAQRLSRHMPVAFTESGSIYSSHSALFAPWGRFTYIGTSKQSIASPSFLALVIDRAMIKNQAIQYEWQLPETRRHNLRIGKMDYTISKKYLDEWQSLEGVGINCITHIPDLGLSIWGNSTLYEVPPATYQALANLSTRKLVNALEDLAYRCGISITFQYNNEQAYNAFYAGMTPLLDTMRNVGAIEDYYLRMAEDVNGLDNVNANSVIGKIYLVVDGVINDINIDLIALPPQTSLDDYRA